MNIKSTEKIKKMTQGLGKIGKKAINSNNLIFTFLRSAVSSQCASWIDMGVGFTMFAWLKLSPVLSTAIGAICGGVVNCIINYKFTFHADNVNWRAVAIKYAIIWICSACLNTFGTAGLYYLVEQWDWLETIGFKRDGYYAASRVFVSLMVSWFWNFPMQRYFVYSVTRFDKYAISFWQSMGTLFSRREEIQGLNKKEN